MFRTELKRVNVILAISRVSLDQHCSLSCQVFLNPEQWIAPEVDLGHVPRLALPALGPRVDRTPDCGGAPESWWRERSRSGTVTTLVLAEAVGTSGGLMEAVGCCGGLGCCELVVCLGVAVPGHGYGGRGWGWGRGRGRAGGGIVAVRLG